MTPARAHVIRRAVVEVHAPATDDTFQFRQEVERWTSDRLLPRLNAIITTMPEMDGATLRIDRLNVEVHCSGLAGWTVEALSKLESALIAALRREWRSEGNDLDGRETTTHLQSFFETFAEYLETGTLPWSRSIHTQAEFETEVEAWLAMPGVESLRPQLATLLEIRDVRKRLLSAVRPVQIKRLLSVAFGMPERVWPDIAADAVTLRRLWPQRIGRKTAKRTDPLRPEERPDQELHSVENDSAVVPVLSGPEVWEAWVLSETIEELAAVSFVYSTDLVTAIIRRALECVTVDKRGLSQMGAIPFQSEVFMEAKKRLLETAPTIEPAATAIAGSSAPAEDPQSAPLPLAAAALKRKTSRIAPAAEGIFIQNAGLVLLAPFLHRLLERLTLANGGELLDAPMAMAVMHYLVSGQEEAAEFQLVLPKVLCGWPLEMPVAVPPAIPKEAKEETHQLLVSAIEHWSVLKDTSPDGLRESFLIRPGKISERGKDEWLLQVEQRAYDMLISHAPWSVSMIKLPWMRRLLRTEWVD